MSGIQERFEGMLSSEQKFDTEITYLLLMFWLVILINLWTL